MSYAPQPGPAPDGWTSANPTPPPGGPMPGGPMPGGPMPAGHSGPAGGWSNGAPAGPPVTPGQPGGNADIAPELAYLLDQYDGVADSVERGLMSIEQAAEILTALQVTDATGALWGLDRDGEFIRREHPDAYPQTADPSMFVTAGRTVPPGPQPGGYIGGGYQAAPGPMPGGYSGTPHQGGGWDGGDNWNNEDPRGGHQPRQRRERQEREPRPPREPRQRRERQGGLPGPLAGIVSWVQANRVTAIILAGVLVLLVGVFMSRDSGTPVPEDPSTPTTIEVPVVVNGPGDVAWGRISGALASGDANQIGAVMVNPASGGIPAVEAARWYGIYQLGFVVTPETSVATDATAATQKVVIADATGKTVATATLIWTRSAADVPWMLTSWPAFSAPSN